MTQDVIMLGAGASKADGAPLQKEIFIKYINQFKQGRIPIRICSAVNPFLKKFFGIDVDELKIEIINYPTFEEVLGVLEIADMRDEYFRESIRTKQSLIHMKKYLIDLIAIVLDNCLSTHYGEYHHYNLIKRLKEEHILQETIFISFNYDIIIDNILIRAFFEEIDYGIEERCHYSNPYGPIRLYKLHGSLNWLFCPYCNSLNLGGNIKTAAERAYNPNKVCNVCGNKNLEPLIIPPTYFKSMGNFYIQKIWREVDSSLRDAQNIFLCGYSLPEADIHIKYLLKKAELFNKNKLLRFYIINGKKPSEQAEEERKRFLGFLKNKQGITYTNMTFEEFSKFGIKNGF